MPIHTEVYKGKSIMIFVIPSECGGKIWSAHIDGKPHWEYQAQPCANGKEALEKGLQSARKKIDESS